jgi:hypothetical protein
VVAAAPPFDGPGYVAAGGFPNTDEPGFTGAVGIVGNDGEVALHPAQFGSAGVVYAGVVYAGAAYDGVVIVGATNDGAATAEGPGSTVAVGMATVVCGNTTLIG